MTFTEEALQAIIQRYTREAGVRNLEREISRVRGSARRFAGVALDDGRPGLLSRRHVLGREPSLRRPWSRGGAWQSGPSPAGVFRDSMRSRSACGMGGVGGGDEEDVREVGTRRRGSDQERVVLLGVRAPPGAPPTDRRGNPSTSCRLRRAGRPGCIDPAFFIIWIIWPGKAPSVGAAMAANLRLVRGRRRATGTRTCGSSRGRSTWPARSCRRLGGPTKVRIVAFGFLTRARTARNSRMRSLIFSRP